MKRKFKILGLSQLFLRWLLLVLSVQPVMIPVPVLRLRIREQGVSVDRVPVVTVSPTSIRTAMITHTHRPDRTGSRRANKGLTFGYSVKCI
jgi:hypothetical protein